MSKNYTGINIQWPISELILSGEKTVETRTYPLPEKYLNVEMLLIETPGKHGKFKARARAIITFSKCIKYKDKKTFEKDFSRHKVEDDSIWAWKEKEKYGWEIKSIKTIPSIDLSNIKKGIVYTKNITI